MDACSVFLVRQSENRDTTLNNDVSSPKSLIRLTAFACLFSVALDQLGIRRVFHYWGYIFKGEEKFRRAFS